MRAYYNEINPHAAQWLRNLIAEGLITPGDVDERSIEDVLPSDLVGYTRCHFFAGIGIWDHALNLAGWPKDRPVWTGSCPCQPFSSTGKRKGLADQRHLWPAWFHLVRQCQPATVFGEQVASNDGLLWLDIVQADLEAAGFAVGAVDLCAAGVGAFHIRQRLYFVADADSDQLRRSGGHPRHNHQAGGAGEEVRVRSGADLRHGVPGGDFWDPVEWVLCNDPGGPAWRPAEPLTQPMVDGSAFVLGSGSPLAGKAPEKMLEAYGNGIVAQCAATFIRSFVDAQVLNTTTI